MPLWETRRMQREPSLAMASEEGIRDSLALVGLVRIEPAAVSLGEA